MNIQGTYNRKVVNVVKIIRSQEVGKFHLITVDSNNNLISNEVNYVENLKWSGISYPLVTDITKVDGGSR